MKLAKRSTKRLEVVLVRPSKYDDEGYVIRYFRGVLPSNTLCCLYGLTEEVAKSPRFAGRIEIGIHAYDESVERVIPERIARRLLRKTSNVLVALVGVQTNQFPRAADLARRFVAAGCKVMIGGFHVSGAIAMSKEMPPECRELMEAGVTLVKGEVENVWGDLLEDAAEERLKPFYDICERPALTDAPIPDIPPGYLKKFVFKHYATIDTSRGCPFNCTFCTVINVQGRKMRVRSPERILRRIRDNHKKGRGIYYYMFTDDNLARNPHWEELFDGMIRMRDEEGVRLEFLMQVDVKAYRIPRFIEKAARAGCTQVFVGIESLNPKNLEGVGKTQNTVDEYAKMVEAWHNVGVHVHAAYIIGFPHDTYDSIMADVDRLAHEIKVDQVSFFMLTPLPGSQDHAEAVAAGVPMDSDFNLYDSFHPVTDHPKMSREEWFAAFKDAWKRFYTPENGKEILLRSNIGTYWGVVTAYLWYRAAMIEGAHPMLTGFFRLKDRKERRPGFAIEPWPVYVRRRVREVAHTLRGWLALYFELEELWLQTRVPGSKIKAVAALRDRLVEQIGGLKQNVQDAGETFCCTVAQVRAALGENIESARAKLAGVSLPDAGRGIGRAGRSSWSWLKRNLNVLSLRGVSTRRQLNAFWKQTLDSLKRGKIWKVNPFLLVWNFLRDARLSLSFGVILAGEWLFNRSEKKLAKVVETGRRR